MSPVICWQGSEPGSELGLPFLSFTPSSVPLSIHEQSEYKLQKVQDGQIMQPLKYV